MLLKDKKKRKPKIIERDKIVYLEDEMDELFEMYPKSFDSKVNLCKCTCKT